MKALFNFEIKRLNKSKVTLISSVLVLIIGILGVVLNYVFYKSDVPPKECMISIYNSYTQFTYLILGFLFVQTFAKDYSKGIVNFYKQMGYGLIKQNVCKMLVLITITIPAIDIFVILSSLFYGNKDWKFLLLIIGTIDLSTVYIILLAMFISSLNKKVVSAVLCFYGLFILFNIINLFALGLANPADGNSIVTYLLSEYAGRHLPHYSLDKFRETIVPHKVLLSLALPGIWCILLSGINCCVLRKINKNV